MAEHDETWKEFNAGVNMTERELTAWLESDDSQRVGDHKDGGESVGHHMGREIVAILSKKKGDLTDEDYAHMSKVNGYIHRHLAQRPAGDVTNTKWCYSLMNWGHDPNK